MILRESAVVVPRNQEVAVVDYGEPPAEVAKMAAEYSGRPVVVEVSCSKQVMAEECNVRPEVEAESVLCKVAEENILALVEVVGIDSDKPVVVVVSVVVEVRSNVVAEVVSCNSKGLAVGVKIEVGTVSEEVVVEEGECSKLEIAVAVRELVVVAVMELAAVGSVSAAEMVVMENMLVAEESNPLTVVVMGESNQSTVVVMEE